MKLASQSQLSSWLPSIHPQVWILAIGRFLSEVRTGFTLFYAPIFFVNQLGLSATSVEVALDLTIQRYLENLSLNLSPFRRETLNFPPSL